mmetsp:Transcript_2546/g.6455  ORF Transcript_2546/g.6455 Transcript_2546/m.6455 type:complete len:184 (+) Transcript_2546:48-599(+)
MSSSFSVASAMKLTGQQLLAGRRGASSADLKSCGSKVDSKVPCKVFVPQASVSRQRSQSASSRKCSPQRIRITVADKAAIGGYTMHCFSARHTDGSAHTASSSSSRPGLSQAELDLLMVTEEDCLEGEEEYFDAKSLRTQHSSNSNSCDSCNSASMQADSSTSTTEAVASATTEKKKRIIMRL